MAEQNLWQNSATGEAPGGAVRKSPWSALTFVLKVIEIRLRFIAILVGIGLLIAYWDTLHNYWDKWTRPRPAATATASDEEFYCPMHPSVVRPTLDPDGALPKCPICGMPLSKRKKGEAPELPAGIVGRVQLSPERIQLAGIETVEVGYLPLVKEIRTVGYVDYDESRLSKIVTRVNGYVEKLYVDKTFEPVSTGDPLAEIYSPELYSAVQELLLANKRGLADLAASGREKLRLLGINNQEIDKIVESAQGSSLVIRSPQTGHVITKQVVEGSRVEEGMTILEVADLSAVWIEADVYEKDLVFMKAGQSIEATVEAIPNRVFDGIVSLVHPHVEKETRTNRVRFELPNPQHELRPGMYATVRIRRPMAEIEPFAGRIAERSARPEGDDLAALAAWQKTCPVTGQPLGSMGPPVEVMIGDQKVLLCCQGCVDPINAAPEKYLARLAAPPADRVLAVPQRAIIDTGSRQVVYIEREPGLFEGVIVELGPRADEFYPVASGLLPGERIAAAGAFLIDAETRLNPAAASTYMGASGSSHGNHAPSAAPSSQPSQSHSQRSAAAVSKGLSPEHLREIAKLPPADQAAAQSQALCPVTGEPLGSMGMLYKVSVQGQDLFLCCKGCEAEVKKDPAAALRKASGRAAKPAK